MLGYSHAVCPALSQLPCRHIRSHAKIPLPLWSLEYRIHGSHFSSAGILLDAVLEGWLPTLYVYDYSHWLFLAMQNMKIV